MSPPIRAHPAASRELGPRAAAHVERERLAEQVRVRAEVPRQVPLDVPQLRVEAEQQIDEPRRFARHVAVREELDRPRPGDRSKREFERAGPVHADQRRVRRHPAGRLRDEAGAIPLIAGEPPRAPERQPVLVPVQLPDHLVVARRRIEIRHVGPEAARRAAARHRIEVPVGGAATRRRNRRPSYPSRS